LLSRSIATTAARFAIYLCRLIRCAAGAFVLLGQPAAATLRGLDGRTRADTRFRQDQLDTRRRFLVPGNIG